MRRNAPNLPGLASGSSLVEFLLSSTISLIVTLAMLTLMSNSLISTARIIKMTKLTDDLRMSMQLMSRDVRRSNYSADAINCFANPDCVADGSLSSPGDVQISQDNDCFIFNLDRDQDGDTTDTASAAFRWVSVNGVGVIEMWSGVTEPDCDASSTNWAAITDPTSIEVTGFTVDDGLSYTEVIADDSSGNQTLQKVRKLRLSLTARLAEDESIQRTIEDVIKLRNNLYF